MASYELADSIDWPSHGENLDPYGLETLDLVWFPLLRDRLKDAQNKGHYYVDNLDVTDSSERGLAKDVIDGRGKFDAREFEKELKSMSRRDLVSFKQL